MVKKRGSRAGSSVKPKVVPLRQAFVFVIPQEAVFIGYDRAMMTEDDRFWNDVKKIYRWVEEQTFVLKNHRSAVLSGLNWFLGLLKKGPQKMTLKTLCAACVACQRAMRLFQKRHRALVLSVEVNKVLVSMQSFVESAAAVVPTDVQKTVDGIFGLPAEDPYDSSVAFRSE